jgi:putative ABC transport system substrate-binding protein
MNICLRRRGFITLLGGAAVWPLAARAQQGNRVRRTGVLHAGAADDSVSLSSVAALAQGLQELGWVIGRNIQIQYRWGGGQADRVSRYAAELVALAPDLILAQGSTTVTPLQKATRTIPIVFVTVADAVGAGFVESLARPGGNITGFEIFEYSIAGKWLELLKQVAPRVARAAVLRNPLVSGGIGQFAAIQAAAASLGVALRPLDVQDAGEIERATAAFAREPNGGLIMTGSTLANLHRDLIIALAARHRLPAVYPYRYFITSGGLISYGPNPIEPWRQAAGYVDRILKGEKPADLPVQAPTKYELAINLKTAKALGLDIPATVYARADEVIE